MGSIADVAYQQQAYYYPRIYPQGGFAPPDREYLPGCKGAIGGNFLWCWLRSKSGCTPLPYLPQVLQTLICVDSFRVRSMLGSSKVIQQSEATFVIAHLAEVLCGNFIVRLSCRSRLSRFWGIRNVT